MVPDQPLTPESVAPAGAASLQSWRDEHVGTRPAMADVDSGEVDDQALVDLASSLGVPFEANPVVSEPERVRRLFPAKVALRFQVLPLGVVDDGGEGEENRSQVLTLATANPQDLVARQAVSAQWSGGIHWVVCPAKRLHPALRELYGVGADTFEQILEGRDVSSMDLEMRDDASRIDAEEDEQASIIKFVNQIIREALEQRATDIHVEPLRSNLRIRYRIDGRLIEVAVPEQIKSLQSAVIARLKIMARLDIAERRLPQDGRIHLELAGNSIDVRVATIPTVEGESVSLRLLNTERFSLTKLQMAPELEKTMRGLLTYSNGIVLVTGPTGSGKSTTLYSFLSELNNTDRRIVTIEDPVENKLEGVMQMAVKPEINFTFATGLRSILRADPNIVMVGEIRDLETAEIAIRASLTGHLVFSTLHTNDAIGGVSRLVDMGVEPFLLSASVRAFLAQRLVRRLCPKCKAHHTQSSHELPRAKGIPRAVIDGAHVAVGCEHCRGTGYYGRLAIFEVVVLSQAIQDLLIQGKGYAEIDAQARAEGFVPMREYGWQKVIDGETTIEEVMSATTTDMS
ncbi:GspE/PulE family protein [Sulfuriroseicoccus oceanibius]|uniref:Type II/IV secretion system protein n=1 Tax=Sulfuriroseicoccus oceanibius TaxID=2707525 RepID=A0A6B3LA91_9BACT|nr:GspE/PulE family protein [Sulfuriroseicoccus oceanibius]QQL44820.1 type II/IV secretion system protein [Sulfuriroseicoccus oceanibius]